MLVERWGRGKIAPLIRNCAGTQPWVAGYNSLATRSLCCWSLKGLQMWDVGSVSNGEPELAVQSNRNLNCVPWWECGRTCLLQSTLFCLCGLASKASPLTRDSEGVSERFTCWRSGLQCGWRILVEEEKQQRGFVCKPAPSCLGCQPSQVPSQCPHP